ncbi:MAG: Bro-N domain-containing protein [Magnetococcales bacterium]|nr:Bro-N domain-containing protein [Magnetococcales bacterium]
MTSSTPTPLSRPAVPFLFKAHQIRVVTDRGDTWFNANDVCAVLGYGDPDRALASHVDAEDQAAFEIIDDRCITRQIKHINKSGTYALILYARGKKSKRFKEWVASKVAFIRKAQSSLGLEPAKPQTFVVTKEQASAMRGLVLAAPLVLNAICDNLIGILDLGVER